MADKTDIEWTDATWNPITGCTIVSAGCTNCYAMNLAGTRLKHNPSRAGLTRISGGRPVWTGEVRLNGEWLDQPLHWRKPRRIFVCAHGDLFHESVPDEWIDRVFAVMALAPQHTFQVLTKRPERMRAWFEGSRGGTGRQFAVLCTADLMSGSTINRRWPPPNVWLGTSVEDQATADARIPHLLATPAAVRFVSAEPLLGPVDLTRIDPLIYAASANVLTGYWNWNGGPMRVETPGLDWVIVGGESGPGARPMHPDWARTLRDQCVDAGVAFHFKQWGQYQPRASCLPTEPDDIIVWPNGRVGRGDANTCGGMGWPMQRVGKRAAGRTLDGRTWDQAPEVKG